MTQLGGGPGFNVRADVHVLSLALNALIPAWFPPAAWSCSQHKRSFQQEDSQTHRENSGPCSKKCVCTMCGTCVHSQVCACTEYVIAYMLCVRRQCVRRLKPLRAVYANTPAQHTSCRLTGHEMRLPDSREHLKLLKCRQLHILVTALLQIAATLRRSTLASLAEGGTKMLAESGPSLWFQGPPPPYLPASALQIKFNRYRMWHHQWITPWVFSLIINVFMWKRRSLQYVTNQEHGQVYREQSIVII